MNEHDRPAERFGTNRMPTPEQPVGHFQLRYNFRPRKAVGEPYLREQDVPMFEEAWRRGGRQALIAAIPDAYVEKLTASGTPRQVLARIQEYRDAGVGVPIVRPAAAHQAARLIDLIASN